MLSRFQLALLSCLLTTAGPLASAASPGLAAARQAVPILCTQNPSARTKTRGTAVVVDSAGVILTAAHVVLDSQTFCTLTLLVPNDEWSRASKFRPFSVRHCVANQLLDIALCHIQPIEDVRDWSYLKPARLRIRSPQPGAMVTITGFTGWGHFPTVVRGGFVSPQQFYRRQDGCYCDFAIEAVTHEGMSGSPLVTEMGEVIGLVTTAGTGKFRGLSFGTSFERAASFLRKAGLNSPFGNN